MSTRRISLSLFLAMFIFWIVLMGRVDATVLIIGATVCLILSLLDRDLTDCERSGVNMRINLIGWLNYFGRLAVAIIKANIQVAGIVLSPRLCLSPAIVTFRSKVKSDLGRTILGNSITLTPGTLTVQAGDEFHIHALTKYHAQALSNRAMEMSLADLEDEKSCRSSE